MISIGFQFDYELNSKNHSKKIKNVLDFFFDFFWIFFDLFLIFLGFFLIFLDCFSIFFDFFDLFRFQLDFNWIFLDFNWISIGFFHERWRSDKPEKKNKKIEKNQKPNPKFFFIFLILIGSIPKSNRIEIQKNQNKIKKKLRKIKKIGSFFITLNTNQCYVIGLTDVHGAARVNRLITQRL